MRVEETHGAADDVVLVGVPADVPHTGVVSRQLGHHRPRQHIVNCEHTHTVNALVLHLLGVEARVQRVETH